jgi:hypothetical protein
MSYVMQALTECQLKIQQIYAEAIQFLHVEEKQQELVDIKKMLNTAHVELESFVQENCLKQQDHQHSSNHLEASIYPIQEQNEAFKSKIVMLQQEKDIFLASRNSGISLRLKITLY